MEKKSGWGNAEGTVGEGQLGSGGQVGKGGGQSGEREGRLKKRGETKTGGKGPYREGDTVDGGIPLMETEAVGGGGKGTWRRKDR